MSQNQPTKQERRDAARREREAQEAAAATAAARKRRLSVLGGIVAAVTAVIVIVVLATGGGDSTPKNAAGGTAVAGVKESAATLAGVPQSGKMLGNPKAPVTMLEFADLQCPFCREYSLRTLPRIVQNYVRAGTVKLELHLLTFLGKDSVRGAAVANAAARQDRLWSFADLFYFNQGKEQTGYATDAFLRQIAGAVPGLDTQKAFAARTQQAVIDENRSANSLAGRYGVTGTPSFVVGPTGGELKLVDGFDYGALKAALDAALKAAPAS